MRDYRPLRQFKGPGSRAKKGLPSFAKMSKTAASLTPAQIEEKYRFRCCRYGKTRRAHQKQPSL